MAARGKGRGQGQRGGGGCSAPLRRGVGGREGGGRGSGLLVGLVTSPPPGSETRGSFLLPRVSGAFPPRVGESAVETISSGIGPLIGSGCAPRAKPNAPFPRIFCSLGASLLPRQYRLSRPGDPLPSVPPSTAAAAWAGRSLGGISRGGGVSFGSHIAEHGWAWGSRMKDKANRGFKSGGGSVVPALALPKRLRSRLGQVQNSFGRAWLINRPGGPAASPPDRLLEADEAK